jgi:hypothetical protein
MLEKQKVKRQRFDIIATRNFQSDKELSIRRYACCPGTMEIPASIDSEANKACQHRWHSCAYTPLQIHDQAYLGAIQ